MKKLIFFFFIISSMIFISGCTQENSVVEKTAGVEEVLDKPTQTEEVLDVPRQVSNDIDESQAEESFVGESSSLINGKTVDIRLQEAYNILHEEGSAQYIRDNFPDIKVVYTDFGDSKNPDNIYPFEYYYSEEADATFNLCNVDRTVFICEGELDRMITNEDMNSGRCIVTPIYRL